MELIDLSAVIKNHDVNELDQPKISYLSHKKGAFLLGLAACLDKRSSLKTAKNFIEFGIGKKRLTANDFPLKEGLAWEVLKLNTHAGTHMDAPFHFGTNTEGNLARTIDEVPLHWCYNPGVLLDLTLKRSGDRISASDIELSLSNIRYELKPFDIVLIKTIASKHRDTANFSNSHPGMTAEAVFYLHSKGVKIIGTDGWGFDQPFPLMVDNYMREKDPKNLWPAHIAGRTKEYCHIEKLVNLDNLPKPYGFKVACFPIKIKKASAGWVRVVAIFE